MTDTVQIALITCVSGLVGSLFGFLTAIMAAKEQSKRETQATLFHSRLVSYASYLEALEKWGITPTDKNAKAYLFRKTAEADLLASRETEFYLDRVQQYVLKNSESAPDADHAQFLMDKSAMLEEMRKDLACQEFSDNSK